MSALTLEWVMDRVSTQTRQPPHSYLMAWYSRMRKMAYTISVIFCSSLLRGLMKHSESIHSCHTEHCSRLLETTTSPTGYEEVKDKTDVLDGDDLLQKATSRVQPQLQLRPPPHYDSLQWQRF
ncbi:hypothetical protein EYF80_000178 [Liparis tanakae]|uniref:Uncharacterized protein n=1 Tax=Liparis tanakae TaxID=230148 RepID=A0A4Z2JH36_9TELE|nr:hypothetical protein EYF80_000178 [Liparis tanakae]